MAETIGVNLVGSAGGFVSAIDSATSSLDRLDKKVGSMGGIGTFLKNTILPAAASIGAAFGASKALSVFGDSDLPGAKRYIEALDASKKAVTALGAAVGEYLAPAAIRVAKNVEWVANKLTPMVRIFTAFSESATQFLLKLASNAIGAFRFMMPLLDDFMSYVENLFTGPARNWQEDIDAFRAWWNTTWSTILDYTAPIIAAAVSLLSQAFSTIQEIAIAAFDAIWAFLEPMLPAFEESSTAATDFAGAVQTGIVTAMATAEFAMKNWQTTAEIAWTAVKLGFQTTSDAIVFYFGQISANAQVVWDNALTGAKFFLEQTKTFFGLVFGSDGYIVLLLKKVFLEFLPELAMNSVAAASDRMLAMTTRGMAGNANATPVIPEFQMPVMSLGGWSRKPDYKALPGFGAMPESSQASALKGSLSALVESFTGGLGEFLKDKLPSIDEQGTMLADALKFMLPDVTATPNDYVVGNAITRDAESTKSTGLAMEGSKEAYKAILAYENRARDEALDIAKAQLQEQKKMADALGAVGGMAAGAIP